MAQSRTCGRNQMTKPRWSQVEVEKKGKRRRKQHVSLKGRRGNAKEPQATAHLAKSVVRALKEALTT